MIADQVQKMDRELGETHSSCTSAHKRIDGVSSKLNSVLDLTEKTSDAILGHMKKEEGMYIVLGWILGIISLSLISFMTWTYTTHTDKMMMLTKQGTMIKHNQEMIKELIRDSKNHKHLKGRE